MGAPQFTNNASSTLAGAITTSATSLSVQTGDGAKFPALSAGQWFPLTLVNASGGYEIVQCTARSGDVFTVVRAQEGTAATAFSAGDSVGLRLTAAAIQALIPSGVSLLSANNLSDLASASTARTNLGLGTAATANTGSGASNVVVRDANGNIPDILSLARVASSGNYYDLAIQLGAQSIGTWSTASWGVAARTMEGRGLLWSGTNYATVIGASANGYFFVVQNGNGALDGTDGPTPFRTLLQLNYAGLTENSYTVWSTRNFTPAAVATSGSYLDLSNKPSIPPIPTSSALPVGFFCTLISSVNVNNNSTVSGANLTVISGATAQSGTWMNISGAIVAAGTSGLFVRTA